MNEFDPNTFIVGLWSLLTPLALNSAWYSLVSLFEYSKCWKIIHFLFLFWNINQALLHLSHSRIHYIHSCIGYFQLPCRCQNTYLEKTDTFFIHIIWGPGILYSSLNTYSRCIQGYFLVDFDVFRSKSTKNLFWHFHRHFIVASFSVVYNLHRCNCLLARCVLQTIISYRFASLLYRCVVSKTCQFFCFFTVSWLANHTVCARSLILFWHNKSCLGSNIKREERENTN